MGLIDLHQSAGFCAQPEAAQDNPQNLLIARTTVLCYVYQTLFSPPTHKKKKSGLAMREYIWIKWYSHRAILEPWYCIKRDKM